MENTETQAKQTAVDGKGAYAGQYPTDMEMTIDNMGEAAGLDMKPEEPVHTTEKMQQRDEERPSQMPDGSVQSIA